MARSVVSFAGLVCLSLAGSDAGVSQTMPLGSEFQVNVFTPYSQARPFVDMDGSGGFVVVWESTPQDGSGAGVFARRFDAGGMAAGGDIQVNTYAANNQVNAAVALSASGAFVVAWESLEQDGSSNGVFARRFNASGSPLGGELQVNLFTLGSQRSTVVGMDADGDFVVAWQSAAQDGSDYGVFARRFSASGVALGAELQVNSHTLSEQSRPAIALAPDGDFVVSWQSFLQDGGGFGVFARRFDSAGAALGGEFQVNLSTTYNERYPAVGVDDAGRFVIAWSEPDDYFFGIVARRFDASGAGLGGEFLANDFTLGNENFAVVDMEPEGGFVIAWNDSVHDGSGNGVFARRYDPAGMSVGGELQVNTFTFDAQQLPGVAISSGSFVVVWQSAGQDGSSNGIFGQRYATAPLDIDGDGGTRALTDGLLVLRFLFGLSGASLVSGAVDPDCTRCAAGAIEQYLETLI